MAIKTETSSLFDTPHTLPTLSVVVALRRRNKLIGETHHNTLLNSILFASLTGLVSSRRSSKTTPQPSPEAEQDEDASTVVSGNHIRASLQEIATQPL
ncbi:hypothetical protein HanPI659440_Chr01g0011951 [Helianthus annuus]|nr:hypothetical protein HanPI659440_Chr01g0011951 [Helianthus annuus]